MIYNISLKIIIMWVIHKSYLWKYRNFIQFVFGVDFFGILIQNNKLYNKGWNHQLTGSILWACISLKCFQLTYWYFKERHGVWEKSSEGFKTNFCRLISTLTYTVSNVSNTGFKYLAVNKIISFEEYYNKFISHIFSYNNKTNW